MVLRLKIKELFQCLHQLISYLYLREVGAPTLSDQLRTNANIL